MSNKMNDDPRSPIRELLPSDKTEESEVSKLRVELARMQNENIIHEDIRNAKKDMGLITLAAIIGGIFGINGIGHFMIGKIGKGVAWLIGVIVFMVIIGITTAGWGTLLPWIIGLIASTVSARNHTKDWNFFVEDTGREPKDWNEVNNHLHNLDKQFKQKRKEAKQNQKEGLQFHSESRTSEGEKKTKRSVSKKKITGLVILGLFVIGGIYAWITEISPEIQRITLNNERIAEQNERVIQERMSSGLDYDCYYDERQKVNNCIPR